MKSVGIVLCGGRSSRMGRAKAWLPWFGRSMIEHVVHQLRPAVDEVWVVTSRELALPPLDARVVEDRETARGPLSGIRDGLAAAAADFAFVTSTDAPFLTPDYVRSMLEKKEAIVPRADGHFQVLSAVYPGTVWKQADELLAKGVGRPLALLERCGFETLEFEPAGSPAPWQGFNTPAEYLDCARQIRPEASALVEVLGRAALELETTTSRVPIGTLREVIGHLSLPESLALVADDRIAKSYLVSLGGRDLVRDLDVPIGPGERVSVIDALAGG